MLKLGMRISIDGKVEANIKQFNELQRILKEEYEIEFNQNLLEEDLTNYKIITKKPVLEPYGTPPDGKAKRRERRKQERIRNKRK